MLALSGRYNHSSCGRPHLRRVKGRKVQARLYLGERWGHVNLGLFETEYAAYRAVKAVLAEVTERTPLGVWRASRSIVARGLAPDVPPKWVRRVPGGYAPDRRVAGATAGVYACPERCHEACLRVVHGQPVPADLWPDARRD